MPKDKSIHKVLVIGSGPIVIGQAAEFDYAGAQACRVLRQEGIQTVLVNSNPATIMTDKHLADQIYLEPLTAKTVRRIIEKERPDGLLAGLGGQTGLTIAMQLSRDGTLARYGVRLLGSDTEAIDRAEDRERFRDTLKAMGQPVIPSDTAENLEEALEIAARIGYPVIVRPAFTLGGAAAAALPRTKPPWQRSPGAGWTSPPSIRFWWSAASPAGRRSNLKPCGTAQATRLPSAPWRTLTRWASTPGIPSWWPRP